MAASPNKSQAEIARPPTATLHQPASPRFPSGGAQRKIAIAVDLSDESAFAVKWAVQNYLRPGDAVILLHVRPTSVLYGADWGAIDLSVDSADEKSQQKLEDDFDSFTTTKSNDLAQPLLEANIPFKIHIVKDHDMKERLCLEVERLGLSAVIMGSRGFGASKKSSKGRLGSVSDYCVHHCVCPVVVVRFPDEKDGSIDNATVGSAKAIDKDALGLHPVPEEEEPVHLDASDKHADNGMHESVCHIMSTQKGGSIQRRLLKQMIGEGGFPRDGGMIMTDMPCKRLCACVEIPNGSYCFHCAVSYRCKLLCKLALIASNGSYSKSESVLPSYVGAWND
ncbi:hypothetical protein BUALT_Bualt03G0066700 [Buddleja alternifolia]|uniref:UspA domain-containing protein n=1 Tax=Buddleja alternifolia TaxID=168488 RepID=A0AAV6XRM0_9LAMI|nr:hypothetical protein BUALT_Bualt03G0066700 [Buddleja alternifolia]